MLEVMKAYIEKCSGAAGVLIEGYPRTTEQVQKYDNVVSTVTVQQLKRKSGNIQRYTPITVYQTASFITRKI